jgi:hypothetical protein
MYDRSRESPFHSAGRCFPSAGRGAGSAFLLAGMFGVLVACSSDDSSSRTSDGGSGGSQNVTGSADAGRQLPGEGFEATPDFDITDPQKPVPPRDELVERVANLNGTGGVSSGGTRTNDAGASDAGDAGAP